MGLTSLHNFYGLWHLYICCAMFGLLNHMKGTSLCVIMRNFRWSWALRPCFGKFLEVIGLHRLSYCYIHIQWVDSYHGYHILYVFLPRHIAVALLWESYHIHLSREIPMFLAAIWSSLCFSSSMNRFISSLAILALHDSNVAVYMQVGCWLWHCSASSGKTMVSILHVDLISCQYF